MKLSEKKCIPCERDDIQPLSCEDVQTILTSSQGDIAGWIINDACTHLTLEKLFPDFVTAMEFVNHVAELAETEGHHPNIFVDYNRVILDLWTHSIGGLSENDFILVAKINTL